ncbi:phospholipase D-like domain-containing protein [Shinella curvata]|uniref:Phospholipase D n=1 Tax=Shinella curvata TaxID=1817964 RepID=A0ABT8XN03_9HYPH|nr:phospholipase D-like domain-containing protein [Shinella curvata]MCJ8056169.1 phospholipase D-like domain-containing protein [Shinella curvata]MDO6125128.1 phospholipase D-like domain-containing protein [Shinella curvata]
MRNEEAPLLVPDIDRSTPIIQPGENAWRVAKADRLDVLVDGQAYFEALEGALEQACREVWIVGWDFNPDIPMQPGLPQSPTLGAFLLRLVEERPELTIRVLVWGMGPVYSGKSLKMFRKRRWSSHPRIVLAFDRRHPIRGSHHQKLVVVDDTVAFVGGIDLTAKRWDTSEHLVDDPRRTLPSGTPYEPVHDMQVALEGEAARLAGDIARRRWLFATDEAVPAITSRAQVRLDGTADMMTNVEVAFARTEPAIRGRAAVTEAMDLTVAALKAARRHIYIESQYFASSRVCDVLCERLSEPDGPEVILISTLSSHGMIERLVLGANRDRFIRRLSRCDKHGRLRAFYPVVPKADETEQEIVIHSKLVIVDDTFLRIGSSNLNQRSEGLDTELDIAMEAHVAAERHGILALRDRLLAEHLDADASSFVAAVRVEGALGRTIDAFNTRQRGLRPFRDAAGKGAVTAVVGTGIVDPVAPWWPISAWVAATRTFLNRQLAPLCNPASAFDPSKASLASSETTPSGSGMKK